MFLRGRLKTKDFLLQRNVACDSCCVLCNCTWETATHVMVHCPYSQEVWKSLLATLNLEPINCTNSFELLDSIILPLENQEKGLQTLGKLIFNAFIWHIWAERNGRIFRSKDTPSKAVVQKITQIICSRINYLGIALPQAVASHWNIAPSTSNTCPKMILRMIPGWRLSICSNNNQLVGILWTDIHKPMAGLIEQDLNLLLTVKRIMQLIPETLTRITIEANSALSQILLNPQKSDWKVRFQARSLHAILQNFEQVQFLLLHPRTARFSKVLSRHSANTHIDQHALEHLYRQNIGENDEDFLSS